MRIKPEGLVVVSFSLPSASIGKKKISLQLGVAFFLYILKISDISSSYVNTLHPL